MIYRTFGRMGWQVSEIGYGMWGMGDWTESDDAESLRSLHLSVELGCNFFDTAWAYGAGHSEKLFSHSRAHTPIINCTSPRKFHRKTASGPPVRVQENVEDCFPADYIKEYTDKSLHNLGVERISVQQFHVWEDDWAELEEWRRAIEDLKHEGKIEAVDQYQSLGTVERTQNAAHRKNGCGPGHLQYF